MRLRISTALCTLMLSLPMLTGCGGDKPSAKATGGKMEGDKMGKMEGDKMDKMEGDKMGKMEGDKMGKMEGDKK
jgi:hypothetical protein